jgi:hypothetical protein
MWKRSFKRNNFTQKLKYSYQLHEIKNLNRTNPNSVIEIFENGECEKTDETKQEYLKVIRKFLNSFFQRLCFQFIQKVNQNQKKEKKIQILQKFPLKKQKKHLHQNQNQKLKDFKIFKKFQNHYQRKICPPTNQWTKKMKKRRKDFHQCSFLFPFI